MPSAPPPPPTPAPDPDEPVAPDAEGSRLVRVGSSIGAAVVAAAVAVIPATLRMSSDVDVSPLKMWTALVAIAIVPMVLAVLALRGARVGLRAFTGPDAGPKAVGLLVWLFWVFVILVPFGSVLRATTHQHSLAGVTYAIGAVVIALGLAIVCARITRIVIARQATGRRVLMTILVGHVVVGVALAALRLGSTAAPPSAGAALVDALAFVLTALFASRTAFDDQPRLAVAGPPLAAILLVIGVSALRGSATICPALAAHAPVFDAACALVRSR